MHTRIHSRRPRQCTYRGCLRDADGLIRQHADHIEPRLPGIGGRVAVSLCIEHIQLVGEDRLFEDGVLLGDDGGLAENRKLALVATSVCVFACTFVCMETCEGRTSEEQYNVSYTSVAYTFRSS